MPVYQVEIIGTGVFKVLRRATIVFEAESQSDAEDQAEAYADRLGAWDDCAVDNLQEIGETAK